MLVRAVRRGWVPAVGAKHALCAPALAAAQVGARQAEIVCHKWAADDGCVLPVSTCVGHLAIIQGRSKVQAPAVNSIA
jgi:hypothetical protein